MSIRRMSAGFAGIMVVAVMGCGEPTNSGDVAVPKASPALPQQVQPDGSLSAFDLLAQQFAWATQLPGGSVAAPTCTILRAYSPSLNFDRTVKIGNCGACIPGSPALAVATSGVGAAGNTVEATARCGSTIVAGPATVADPGRGGVNLNASAGIQVAGVPDCARSYSGVLPQSNRSFTCIFF